jgi:hypothetical protein
MRDYVRGKGWVGAKDGKPVDPTTGQPREDTALKAGAPITKERDYAIWVANNILDDPLRDPDSDTSVLARHFIRSLEPAAGSAALLDACVGKILDAVLALIQADPHQWSNRPCETCRTVGTLVGKPFGCYEYQRRKAG